jgi:ureidoglycolate lyase
LVLVCLGDNAPDPDTLRLFSVQGQGVNYHAGTWHFPLLSLETVRNFWVVDRVGHGNNLDEHSFSDDVEITISEYRSHSE